MLETLNDLLRDQVRDLYSAENQLVKALPKMAKAASSVELKKAFTSHLDETKGHVERLAQIAELIGCKPGGKKCKAMEGLVEEGAEVLGEKGDGAVIDAALIAAAQRVEHYEISAYGTARAIAAQLGLDDVAELFQATLSEESACDEKLTEISEDGVLSAASEAGENSKDK